MKIFAISDLHLDINNKNTDALDNAGLCYAELKNLSKAKELLEKAITIDPNYSYAYYALALAYEKEKNIDAAIENYQKFLDLSNDNALKSEIKAKINYLKSK